MEDNPVFLYILGSTATIITILFAITKALVGKQPITSILNAYKKQPKFSYFHFEVVENSKVVGKINNNNIELIPNLKEEGGIEFIVTIDLSIKPKFNNYENLKNALGKIEFRQNESSVILTKWEPDIFDYGNFEKILNKLQFLIDKIENKTI